MKKRMVAFILIVCTLGVFSSCSAFNFRIDGYDKFSLSGSSFGLNTNLLPCEDFADMFPYIDIDYHLRDKTTWNPYEFYETVLVDIQYEQDVYKQAKEYCLQNMSLDDLSLDYNGYRFVKYATDNPDHIFPHWFQMFVFNDNTGTLIFLGIYLSEKSYEDEQEVKEHWGDFVERYFSENFDWINVEQETQSLTGDGMTPLKK